MTKSLKISKKIHSICLEENILIWKYTRCNDEEDVTRKEIFVDFRKTKKRLR